MQSTQKNYPMPAQFLQDLVDYLQTKPYQEVAGFLVFIQNLARQIDFPSPVAVANDTSSDD